MNKEELYQELQKVAEAVRESVLVTIQANGYIGMFSPSMWPGMPKPTGVDNIIITFSEKGFPDFVISVKQEVVMYGPNEIRTYTALVYLRDVDDHLLRRTSPKSQVSDVIAGFAVHCWYDFHPYLKAFNAGYLQAKKR